MLALQTTETAYFDSMYLITLNHALHRQTDKENYKFLFKS